MLLLHSRQQPGRVLEQLLGSDFGAVDKRLQLRPRNLVVQTPAQAAVRGGHDVLRAYELSELDDAIGHELRVLHCVGRVRDHAWVDDGALWQLVVLPHAPLMSVTRRGPLEGEAADLRLQNLLDDVTERNVGHMRAVPGAPADVEAGLLARDVFDGLVEDLNALMQEGLEVLHGRLWDHAVPCLGQIWGVELYGQTRIGDGFVLRLQRLATSSNEVRVLLVVLVRQARGRSRGKGRNEAILRSSLVHCVLEQLHVRIDLVLADVGNRAGELWVRNLLTAGEDAGIWIIVGVGKEGAVAAVLQRTSESCPAQSESCHRSPSGPYRSWSGHPDG